MSGKQRKRNALRNANVRGGLSRARGARLPAAPHTDAAHEAITAELVRLTLLPAGHRDHQCSTVLQLAE